MEQQLKKCRKEITDELMEFISKFEVKDQEYLYLELRYLSKIIDNYKYRLISDEEIIRKKYNDMEKRKIKNGK